MTAGVKESVKSRIEALQRVATYSPAQDSQINLFAYDIFLAPTSIKNKQRAACQRSGVKVIRIHDFRHSHVSLLVNMGFNPFEIAKRLGHTVEMVNNVYSHWFMESQINMVRKLDEQEAMATRRPMN
jgi:integrase